jgi:CheY-like chemotaxis protein
MAGSNKGVAALRNIGWFMRNGVCTATVLLKENHAMAYDGLKNKSILIVEDDPSMAERLVLNLEDLGCNVVRAGSVKGAERLVDEAESPLDIAVLDLYIPETDGQSPDRIMRGEELAYTIRKRSRRTKIIGLSANLEREPLTPINDLFSGFIYKGDFPRGEPPIILFETIEAIVMAPERRLPKVFVVHGHDDKHLFELKDYLQNTLKLGQPTILREKPSSGRTIIEKFEREGRDVDVVFVLMTPDDKEVSQSHHAIWRARQNVIFELGFFYAKLQRGSGKIIVLKDGEIELPSDIVGIAVIDVSQGLVAAGDSIRAELQELGWLN